MADEKDFLSIFHAGNFAIFYEFARVDGFTNCELIILPGNFFQNGLHISRKISPINDAQNFPQLASATLEPAKS